MPTWPTHLKIANKLANKYHYTDDFIIGNVFPDTMNGYIVDSPSSIVHHTITHYSHPDYYDFLDIDTNKFLQENRKKLNNELLLGIYSHLLTDYYFNEYVKKNHFKREKDNRTLAILKDGTIEENIHPMVLKQNDFINYGNYLIKNKEIGNEVSITKDTIELTKDLNYKVEKEDITKTVDKINEYINTNINELNEYVMFEEKELADLFNSCLEYVDKKISEYKEDIEISKAFDNYVIKYDMEDEDISYKYHHSYRVMENSKYLAEQLHLSDIDKKLATIIGLYHDIGRFEQDKRFDSYNDTKTFDHGDYGEEVLIKQEIIKEIPIEISYHILIGKAVKNHNKYTIEEGLNNQELLHAKLIRDADKLDIIYYLSEGKFRNKTFDYSNNEYSVRDDIREEFLKKQCINIKNKKEITNSEKALVILALIFDLNFKETAEYIISNNMLDNLYNRLPNREKYKEYFELVNKHLKEMIKC